MKPPGQLTRSKPLQRTPWVPTPETIQKARERGRRNQQAAIDRSRILRSERPVKVPRQRRATGEGRGREFVYGRSGGLCEVRILGICLRRATNFHHRLDRIHGGTWAAFNGLHVCGSATTGCHGALTEPPPGRAQEFEDNGWTVPSWVKPAAVAEVSVLISAMYGEVLEVPVRVLLSDTGGYLPAGEVA